MSENTNALQEMDKLPIPKAVIKNVLPAVASMLMSLIYNMADKIFIGMTGNDYMVAAITMATPVFVLFMSFGNIFGTGGVAMISRLTGEGNLKKSAKVSSFCCWGSFGVGVVVTAVMLVFMAPILRMLGASDAQTVQYTRDYLSVIAVCCPFSILSTTMSSLVRADGKPTQSMIGMILGNAINIVLDPVFILGCGMGTRGAAIATLIGQVASAFYYVLCIRKGNSNLSVRPKDFAVGDGIAARVFAIGTPAALGTVFQSVCNILMNNLMGHYGDLAVAGIGAAQNITNMIGIFAIAVAMGIQPLLGYQVGNGNRKKFKAILRYSVLLAGGISLALTLLCYLFTTPVINVFVSSPEAVGYGVKFARIILSTVWLYCLFTVFALVLQAMGMAMASSIVNLSRNAYVFIPVMYLMNTVLGMDGIVWALPVSDVICMVITLVVLKRAINKCFRAEQTAEGAEQTAFREAADFTGERKAGYIITIGRSYGSGGRSVGRALAERLDIPFYDKEIIWEAAKETGLSKVWMEQLDEKGAMTNTSAIYDVYTADKPFQSVESIAYQAQKNAVEAVAKKGACVIVGRRADQILQGKYPAFRVFISALPEKRVKRIVEREGISPSAAEQKIREIDRERALYYNGFSGRKWGTAENYDLSLDLTELTPTDAAEIIITAIRLREQNKEQESNHLTQTEKGTASK